MTLTADTAIPAAGEQPKCPPWCTYHHPDAEIHRAERVEVDFWKNGVASWVTVTSIDFCQGDGPEVSISGWRQVIGTGEHISPNPVFPAAQARELADLIEVLQNATPGRHREIAAAIRQAAAVITEAGQ
jgi:hypothetical protein